MTVEAVSKKKTVVAVVDDDEYILEFLKFTLEGAGFHVTSAADGEKGLEIMAETPPAVLLLDLMLPKIDGFGVLKKMAKDSVLAGIPVVILSAYAAGETTRRLVLENKNVREVFNKPVRSQDLLARLRQIIG